MTQTILVVDDDERLRALVGTYLTQAGFRVLMAGNGAEALRLAHAEKPDLVILDVMMPEMDGYAFLRAFRRDASTPVILLTARVDARDASAGRMLGANDYVTKPFSRAPSWPTCAPCCRAPGRPRRRPRPSPTPRGQPPPTRCRSGTGHSLSERAGGLGQGTTPPATRRARTACMPYVKNRPRIRRERSPKLGRSAQPHPGTYGCAPERSVVC